MRRALVAGLLHAVLIVPAVAAQEILAHDDGTISVHASGAPLGQVLRAIGEVHPFEKLAIDPDVEGRAVTVTLEQQPVARALVVILRSADVDYVMVGLGRRLGVGDREFVAGVQRALDDDVPTGETIDLAAREQEEIAAQSFFEPELAETGMGVDEAIEPPDPVAIELKRLELERALTPSGPRVRSGWIELPFPGPDGLPMAVFQPVGTVTPSLPFPVAPATPAASADSSAPGALSGPVGSAQPGMLVTAPQPASQTVPAVVDPKLQQLIQALSPPVAPERR